MDWTLDTRPALPTAVRSPKQPKAGHSRSSGCCEALEISLTELFCDAPLLRTGGSFLAANLYPFRLLRFWKAKGKAPSEVRWFNESNVPGFGTRMPQANLKHGVFCLKVMVGDIQ